MIRFASLLVLAGVLLASAAFAQDAEQEVADACCRQIVLTAVELKYDPGCITAAHLPATLFTPCRELCVDAPEHQPVLTCYPCGSACVPDACHGPATVSEICEHCAAEIELTGCRCLLEEVACEGDCADSCGCR